MGGSICFESHHPKGNAGISYAAHRSYFMNYGKRGVRRRQHAVNAKSTKLKKLSEIQNKMMLKDTNTLRKLKKRERNI